MPVKPISPAEAIDLQPKPNVPDAVFEVINKLIVERFDGSSMGFDITEDELIGEAIKLMDPNGLEVRRSNFLDPKSGWLKFEDDYIKEGWVVNYWPAVKGSLWNFRVA